MIPAQIQTAIKELHALEIYFEEGRNRANKARRDLECFYTPVPLGAKHAETVSKVLEMNANRTLKIINGAE